MPTTIKIKQNPNIGVIPLASELERGELAVNLPDRKIYTKDQTDTVVPIGGSGGDTLPLGVDGDMLANIAGDWEVPGGIKFGDDPSNPGTRELSLTSSLGFRQYSSIDKTVTAFEVLDGGDLNYGTRSYKTTGAYGTQLSTNTSNNNSFLLLRNSDADTNGIELTTGATGSAEANIGGTLTVTGVTSLEGVTFHSSNVDHNFNLITRVGDPTSNDHAMPRSYADLRYLQSAADNTFTGNNSFTAATFFTAGNVDFNSTKLTRVGNPTSNDHAMPRSYADARYQAIGSYATTNTTQTISGTKTFSSSRLRFQGTTTSNFFCGYTGSSTFTVGAGGVAVFADEAAAVLTMIVDAIQAGPSVMAAGVEQPIRDLIALIATPRP